MRGICEWESHANLHIIFKDWHHLQLHGKRDGENQVFCTEWAGQVVKKQLNTRSLDLDVQGLCSCLVQYIDRKATEHGGMRDVGLYIQSRKTGNRTGIAKVVSLLWRIQFDDIMQINDIKFLHGKDGDTEGMST
jgi:hypothetical protein